MRAGFAVAIGAAVITLPLTGCGLPSAGPTCSQFISMASDDQQKAMINWAKRHDSRVDPNNPNSFASGAALFADHASMSVYCGESGHGGDHINNLSPTG